MRPPNPYGTVLEHEVAVGFALDDYPGPPIIDHNYRRTQAAIVVRGHRIAVCSGGRHDEDVARLRPRDHGILDQDVATFAVFSRHRYSGVGRYTGLVGKHALIVGVVQHWPDIVTHAPV